MNDSESKARSTVAEALDPEEGTDDETPTAGRPEATGEETLSLDLVFEILKNGRRRMVLEQLESADGEVTISDLSETIAARENGKSVDEISSEERKRVYVGLYQCHLPKMDDAGIVEFNKDRGLVVPGAHAGILDEFMPGTDPEPPDRVTDPRPWLAVTLLTGGLLGASLVVEAVAGVSTALLSLAGLVVLLGALTAREFLGDD